MPSNNSGSYNTAAGFQALGQTIDTGDGTVATGNYNTAVGERALGGLTTGSYNATLGAEAGSEVNTANNVICIGAGVLGVSRVVGEMDDSCYIGNIYNAPLDLTTALPVLVDQDGKLGTQGFDGSKVAVRSLQDGHLQRIRNQSLEEHRKVDEQQARIATLESKVASQEFTIAEQQKTMNALATQLKDQAEQIQRVGAQIRGKLTTEVVLNNP
jgi:uncharacterized coiled-coil protein SlyX